MIEDDLKETLPDSFLTEVKPIEFIKSEVKSTPPREKLMPNPFLP